MSTLNEKITNVADGVRTLSATTSGLTLDQMASNVEAANSEITNQSELISQIMTALEGKAAGGSAIEYLELSQSVGEGTMFWSPTDVFIDSYYAKGLMIRASMQYDNIIKGTYISVLTTYGGFPVVVNPSNAVELVRTIDYDNGNSYNIYKINSSCSFTMDD